MQHVVPDKSGGLHDRGMKRQDSKAASKEIRGCNSRVGLKKEKERGRERERKGREFD